MELSKQSITIKGLQQYIKNKDNNPGQAQGYFLKLIEETGELAQAIRENKTCTAEDIKDTIDEELYDVLYYVLAIANLYDIDLEKTARLKEAINSRRTDH